VSAPRTAVVTIVHGRADHLARQQASLARQTMATDLYVVVAMDDPGPASWRPPAGPQPHVVDVRRSADGRLPLAHARNEGVQYAVDRGAEVVVLLDVDCLAGPGLVADYADAAGVPGTLWCGPVTYLPPAPDGGYPIDAAWLEAADAPHPARPAPAQGTRETGEDWSLFWSLSFALRAEDWAATGGFCEDYTGYGGEDTDFALLARAAGLRLGWTGGARAYHQHHPVSRPPVEHTADIVRNGRLFADRWGWWPMEGWLRDLAAAGHVVETADGWESLVVEP